MDFALYLIFTILGVILSNIGFFGGIWLWKKMAESPILKDMQKPILIVGFIGTFSLLGIILFSLWSLFTPNLALLRSQLTPINNFGGFMLAYLIGYDFAISKEMPSNNPPSKSFQLQWRLVKILCTIFLIITLLFAIAVFLKWISMDIFFNLLISLLGGCLGYLFWEHLKTTGIIKGKFRIQLLILSLITTTIMGLIWIYSVINLNDLSNVNAPQNILVSIILFIWCMFCYFLGLIYAVLKNKKEKRHYKMK